MPTVMPKPVKTSEDAKAMLRFDLENENETIINYRQRVRQCEALGEYTMAEQIRQILSTSKITKSILQRRLERMFPILLSVLLRRELRPFAYLHRA